MDWGKFRISVKSGHKASSMNSGALPRLACERQRGFDRFEVERRPAALPVLTQKDSPSCDSAAPHRKAGDAGRRRRLAEDVPDHLLAHLSPLGWEHINLTGDYVWSPAREMTENRDGFLPLRPAPDPALMAA
jgi:Tn3 transposase DDE domain